MIKLACGIKRNNGRLFLMRIDIVYGPDTFNRHIMQEIFSDLLVFGTPW